MVEVLDQFGLQAAIPAVVFGPARSQGLPQLSGGLRVEGEERELRVLHERVEQGSARLLGGDVDIAPRGEFRDELQHPVVKGLRRVLDLHVPPVFFIGQKQADVVFGVSPVDAHESRNWAWGWAAWLFLGGWVHWLIWV
jgi:hypothetical protein